MTISAQQDANIRIYFPEDSLRLGTVSAGAAIW